MSGSTLRDLDRIVADSVDCDIPPAATVDLFLSMDRCNRAVAPQTSSKSSTQIWKNRWMNQTTVILASFSATSCFGRARPMCGRSEMSSEPKAENDLVSVKKENTRINTTRLRELAGDPSYPDDSRAGRDER